MKKNVPEIKWLIVLLEKEVKNTQKSISNQKRRTHLCQIAKWLLWPIKKVAWERQPQHSWNRQVSEDYRKGSLQVHGQAERKSEEDLRVIHDNHKAGCENKLHPAYHLLEKMKLLSKPVFKNFISNKVQNAVWIAIFMQLFLVALDKIFFKD